MKVGHPTTLRSNHSPGFGPLDRTAYNHLVNNISNKIGDGGPVDHLKVTPGKNARVSFKGETFLGPGGGMVHFSGTATSQGKIVTFRSGQPQ